ncbi:MAG TPA: elongation factor P [Acidobacteriota bacterium]|nr:elongation factor P [Acidobacteriota bacterium]HMZ79447.1 elongation factor P [Acidobacteriota bacterium]HNB72920.1 elongation factor P [Acidobacteriota bacterium]HND18656.1 elongation factor P [Acidobacteriota bacterium]HNG93475.1 elongation factor P [Acidobacteriota bacterium]
MRANQIRRGTIIIFNGEPHRVVEFRHHTPGNLRAMVQTKLKSVKTGSAFEHRFSATEDVERATLEQHDMNYLYSDGTTHHFMNNETYEQIGLDEEMLGDAIYYMTPDLTIQVEFFDGSPIGISLPPSVELRVAETDPELKGATVSGSSKPAKLETGLTVNVPGFIKEGELIRVDTTEGTYIERVK